MELDQKKIRDFVEALQKNPPPKEAAWDQSFLQNYRLTDLYDYAVENWLALYKIRQQAITDTPFCWTRNYTYLINQYWLQLAEHIASLLQQSDILSVIFPELIIDEDLRKQYQLPLLGGGGKHPGYDFVSLCYQDGHTHLLSAQDILDRHKLFAYYEDEKCYPVSPYVFKQIVEKGVLFDTIGTVLQRTVGTPSSAVDFDECLYPLFAILKKYFDIWSKQINSATDLQDLHDQINILYRDDLIYLHVDTVNYFYAQSVNTNRPAPSMILELLLHCFSCKVFNHALPNMMYLAAWICEKNPALIIPKKHRPYELNVYYKNMQRGEYYPLSSLRQEFLQLQKYVTHSSLTQIILLLNQFVKQKIDDSIPDLYKQICILYETYYHHHDSSEKNKKLIVIWQLLSGSGFLISNGMADSMCLLFKNSTGIDLISREPMSSFPLAHVLIGSYGPCFLDSCYNNYKVNGNFENQYTTPVRPFTDNEFEKIQKIAKFKNLPQFAPEYERPYIAPDILEGIYNLVNLAFHPKALQIHDEKSANENHVNYPNSEAYEKSCLSFTEFRDFFNTLSPDVRDLINKIRIRYKNYVHSFEEIWSDGFPECMAVTCRYFAILYVNYDPSRKFNAVLENILETKHGDFLNQEREQAKRRNQGERRNSGHTDSESLSNSPALTGLLQFFKSYHSQEPDTLTSSCQFTKS